MSKGKRNRRERPAPVPEDDPIVVHLPADPELELAAGDAYRAQCGKMAKLPDTVVQRRCDPMPKEHELYLVAGPHPRYHEVCRACEPR